MSRKPFRTRRSPGRLFAVLILACLGFSMFVAAPLARAEQGQITAVVSVPADIRAMADKMTSDVDWIIAYKFTNFYRLLGKDKSMHNLTADVNENGTPQSVRTYFSLSELPAVVRNALKRSQPDFTVDNEGTGVYAMGRTDREILSYRVEGSLPNQKDVTLSIAPDGSRVVDAAVDVPELKFRTIACRECGFSFEAPGEATVRDLSQNGMIIRQWIVSNGAATFDISYSNFQGRTPQGYSAFDLIRAYREGGWRGQTFSGDRQLLLGNARIPGLEFAVASPTQFSRVRIFLKDKNELYVLSVQAPKASVGAQGPLRLADVDRFLNSLTIGQAPAAQPSPEASARWTPGGP